MGVSAVGEQKTQAEGCPMERACELEMARGGKARYWTAQEGLENGEKNGRRARPPQSRVRWNVHSVWLGRAGG